MSYNIYQLNNFAKKYLKDNYDMEMAIPLKFNGRLKRCCGRFMYYEKSHKPVSIEMNTYFVENNEPKVVLDVLKHELIHYVVFMQGKPFIDGQSAFENELRKRGVVSQSTIDKYAIVAKAEKYKVYKCVSCNAEHRRKRALPNEGKNHHCGCKASGRLQYLGEKVVST